MPKEDMMAMQEPGGYQIVGMRRYASGEDRCYIDARADINV